MSDADILSLIESHVVIVVLVALLVRLFILIEVNGLYGWESLQLRVFPFLVIDGVHPLLVPVSLFLENAHQKLIVVQSLSNLLLILPDASCYFTQCVGVLVQ